MYSFLCFKECMCINHHLISFLSKQVFVWHKTNSHFLFPLSMSLPLSSPKWLTNCAQILNSFICFIVFFIFDLLDAVFCVIYRILDKHIEGESSPCCCSKLEKQNKKLLNHEYDGESDSLYERKSIFREMGFLQFGRKQEDSNRKCGEIRPLNRWSDCGCESCLSWVNGGDYKLHFVVKEPVMGMLI